MKNNIAHIFTRVASVTLLVLGIQGCNEDVFNDNGQAGLVGRGQYLATRNAEQTADNVGTLYFEANTPYRLVAFAKAYDENNPADNTPADKLRFNKVAWEGEAGGLHFLNLDRDPAKWFGFKALDGENEGTDGLVSLDFYGFTYGSPADNHTADYIRLDGVDGENVPDVTSVAELTRTESVSADGTLKDLMHGVLTNQNEQTAGKETGGQSIIPFKHCFSKLSFLSFQQHKDGDETAPMYEDLKIEGITLTGTYSRGTVSLADGKVRLANGDKKDRGLNMAEAVEVQTENSADSELGTMLVMPSDESGLYGDISQSYVTGLKIEISSPDRDAVDRFLVNTKSGGNATKGNDGRYYGTIIIPQIYNSYSISGTPLYFKQNTSYQIVISFLDNSVRIITLVPLVWEWIPGEGTADDPWQDQALGQPQVFDNVVWSDRNLGADDYDADNNFIGSIGYYYQSFRNIPYFPFNYKDLYEGKDKFPEPADKNKGANNLSYSGFQYTSKFWAFPMVDKKIMGNMPASWNETDAGKLMMDIPETAPTNKNFAFFDSKGYYSAYEKDWSKVSEQPVPEGWEIPTADQMAALFPTTPFAGNLTFRKGGQDYIENPSLWGFMSTDESDKDQNVVSENCKVLRVCVPYYNPNKDDAYNHSTAWAHWKSINDPGSTEGSDLNYNYFNGDIMKKEPQGDPIDGFCSVYIISRERDGIDRFEFPATIKHFKYYTATNREGYAQRDWGTIYGIKKVGTAEAYRMRWKVICKANRVNSEIPDMYIEVSRYRCSSTDNITEDNYKSFDWDHPSARLYFPISGLVEGDVSNIKGRFYNMGTEGIYATATKDGDKNKTLRIKISGDAKTNQYIAVISESVRHGKQLRLVRSK